MAAPTTPSRGKPSRPKISSELKTKLTTMAAMLAFIGSTVSPRLSQGPRDALRNGEGDKPHHHNVHVFPRVAQRRGGVLRARVTGDVIAYERRPRKSPAAVWPPR